MTKKQKPKRKVAKGPTLKKPRPVAELKTWHRLTSQFVDGMGIQPASVDGVPIFIPGKLANVPVIMVPMSSSPEQILAIAKTVKAITNSEALVLTSNVKLLRLVPVSDAEVQTQLDALRMLSKGGPGIVVEATDAEKRVAFAIANNVGVEDVVVVDGVPAFAGPSTFIPPDQEPPDGTEQTPPLHGSGSLADGHGADNAGRGSGEPEQRASDGEPPAPEQGQGG